MDNTNVQLVFFPVQLNEFIHLMRVMIREEIQAQKGFNKEQQKDEWMDLEQLIEYLPEKPAKSTIYAKLAKHQLPGHKKTGSKSWIFLKS